MAGRNGKPRECDIERWREFAKEYTVDWNATAAIIRCKSYSSHTDPSSGATRSAASRLLTYAYVQDMIKEELEARSKRLELSQDVVIREYLRVALADVRNYFKTGKDGIEMIPSEQWTDDTARAINRIDINEYTSENGTTRNIKIYTHSKISALDSLAKHLGMFKERHEHTFPDSEDTFIEDTLKVLDQTEERLYHTNGHIDGSSSDTAD